MRVSANGIGLTRCTARATVPGGQRVLVWDRAVRLFHWLLVAGIVIAWISGGSGHRIHEVTGFGIAALVAFRLAWGVIGSPHARFGDFLVRPGTVLSYFHSHFTGHPARYIGHNPAGGYMIIALIAVILLICATGTMQLSNRFFGVDWVETLHHYAANALWGLVALHVTGAFVASRVHEENLVGAMITGWKPLAAEARSSSAAASRARRRLKLEHRMVRVASRRGAPALVACLACGFGYGWLATSGRVHIEHPAMTARLTPDAAAPARAGPHATASTSPGSTIAPAARSAQPRVGEERAAVTGETKAQKRAQSVGAGGRATGKQERKLSGKRNKGVAASGKRQRSSGREQAVSAAKPSSIAPSRGTSASKLEPVRTVAPRTIPPPPYALGAPMPRPEPGAP